MSDALSDYAEGKIIDLLFRTGGFTKPTNIYLSLHIATLTDAGTGAEVTGGSYARVLCGPLDADWSAPTGGNGQTSNLVAFTFPTPTANWGTVTSFGIWDASGGGNLLARAALTASKTINNGDAAPSFPIGSLVFTLT